jgi:UDP-glucose 4-epimerase
MRSGDNLPPPQVKMDAVPILRASIPRADIIYHLAGPVGPVGVLKQAGRIVPQIIADATLLARSAIVRRIPLVYVSTSEIYGANGYHDIPETAPRVIAAGHSARMEYAVAKLAAETMLLNTAELDVRIVRPFNVAGPRQKTAGGFVLPRFIEQAQNGDPLTVYTPGSQRRAFTHVSEIVDGIWRVAQYAAPKTVWNLGNPANECSILELALQVKDLLASSSEIEIVDPKKLWGYGFAEAPDKIPNIEVAKDFLGWQPVIDRAQIILDAAGRAAGGPVTAGQGYVVGERGSEIFFVDRDSHIWPNKAKP